MRLSHIADQLLQETIGKSLLNGRRVQIQVLEPSRKAKVNKEECVEQGMYMCM